jgi:hypothetical protein
VPVLRAGRRLANAIGHRLTFSGNPEHEDTDTENHQPDTRTEQNNATGDDDQ